MTEYRARIIRDPNRSWEAYNRVSIGVSMDNPNTTGAKFQAMVDFVNGHRNFDHCIICVSDTLSAWNEVDDNGIVHEDARKRAMLKGDAWLTHNASAISQLLMPVEIVRWDQWRNHADFAATLRDTRLRYATIAAFRNAVDADVAEVMQRRAFSSVQMLERFRANSVHFFIEEIAGYRLFYRIYGPAAKMYPGTQIRSFLIPEAPEELKQEYFMQVHIRRAGALAAPTLRRAA